MARVFRNRIHRSNYSGYSPNMLLSGSRDKTLIIWNLTRDEQAYGYPKRSLEGHSHIVSDCVCNCPSRSRSRTESKDLLENQERIGIGLQDREQRLELFG